MYIYAKQRGTHVGSGFLPADQNTLITMISDSGNLLLIVTFTIL